MFDTSEYHIDYSLSTLGSASNPLGNNSVDPLLPDLTGFGSQQLLTLAGEALISAWQNQTNPTQALVYTAASIFNTNFAANAEIAFGEAFDISKAEALGVQILGGTYGVLPNVQFLFDGEINGANGAYAESTNTIYINSVFLTQNADNPTAISKVLVEETGHFLDAYASPVDSSGDEGEILAGLVAGNTFTEAEFQLLKSEDDTATIILDNQLLIVEQSSNELSYNTPILMTDMAAFNGNNSRIVAGDFNGDGKTDVIRQEVGSWVDGVNDAQVYISNGNGTFSSPILMTDMLAFNGNYSRIVTGDFNGDGKTDVIRQEIGDWVNGNNDAQVYISNGNGTFSSPILMTDMLAFNGNYSRIVTGDFNGDGKTDVIRQEVGDWVNGNNDAQVYISNGNGTFSSPILMTDAPAFNGNNSRIVAGDFNGDGKTDVIRQEFGDWVNGSNDTQVYLSNGNGTFSSPILMTDMVAFNGNYSRIVAGDFNSDGKTDVIRQEFGDWVNGSSDTQVYISSTVVNDWYTQNLLDAQIISLTRSLAADGSLSRNDIISIFRDANDDNVINANELTDLRTIVSNYSHFSIADYVRVLSSKIANSDVANAISGIGNLYAGSSANQMESLISKWFLGNDRPDTPYGYQYASGSLFQNGVSYQDIKQGIVGDCYFLAGLGATALRASSAIQNMFIDNGDNTFSVRFYNNGVADYVTVDRYLPTDSFGRLVYANMESYYNSSSNELWVALAEKAYAQLNESGWIGQDNTNSYDGISGGWEGYVIQQVTGINTSFAYLEFTTMVNAFNSGALMGIDSKEESAGVASNIVPNHAYVVVGYNSSTQKFTLFNPWGVNGGYYGGYFKPGTLELSWSEITASFVGWSRTI